MTVSSSTAGSRPGICTAANRPLAPYEGQIIYETDTDRTLQWTGTAWDRLNRSGTFPNFLVFLSGGNGASVSGATIAYNSTLYDDTSSVSSGIFTVPGGQGGLYCFNVRGNVYNIGTAGHFRMQIVTAGSYAHTANGVAAVALGSNDTFSEANLICKLIPGDTVLCRFVVPQTGNYSAGIIYNAFSGYRIA